MSKGISFINYIVFSFATLLVMAACEPKEEMLRTENDFLYISTDTLRFDTLFSEQLSISRRAKVINPHAEAVLISTIDLAVKDDSPFELIVNGRRASEFRNQTLIGGDSLLLLVNVTTPQTTDTAAFRIHNVINIATQQYNGTIALEATGENVDYMDVWHFTTDTVIAPARPIVIEKGIIVNRDVTLTLKEGSRIYFKSAAEFKVYGSLVAEGSARERVVLRSFRRDGIHRSSLGQWQGIELMKGSSGHRFSGISIFNAINGISWEGDEAEEKQTLTLTHANIQHASKTGLSLKNIHLNADNLLLNNCVDHLLLMNGTVTLNMLHCTLANYSFNFFRSKPSLSLGDAVNASIQNSVIWGNLRDEITLNSDLLSQSNNFFRSSNSHLAKSNSTIDVNPEFVSPPMHNFLPDSLSPLLEQAIPGLSATDNLGNNRKAAPDIGAFERLK